MFNYKPKLQDLFALKDLVTSQNLAETAPRLHPFWQHVLGSEPSQALADYSLEDQAPIQRNEKDGRVWHTRKGPDGQ